MTIPEQQLETWAGRGATATAASTYTSVKAAVDAMGWTAEQKPIVYLQGSYKNDTNIYSESDVDIVVEFACTFKSDVSALPAAQQTAHQNDFVPATYLWEQAYHDTLRGLVAYYGNANVHPRTKAVQVDTPYRSADVIVAIGHRKYSSYISVDMQKFEPGITINVPKENRWIINFPKQHFANGVSKQASTSDRYKGTVRMFKNANRYMVSKQMIAEGTAPSYCIECMVYSAPDVNFVVDRQNTFCNVLNWANSNWTAIRRVSEQGGIVGTQPEMWNPNACQDYIAALVNLWNKWP